MFQCVGFGQLKGTFGPLRGGSDNLKLWSLTGLPGGRSAVGRAYALVARRGTALETVR